MKIVLTLAAAVLGLAATSASAVNCVGGPRYAFYAYSNPNDAYICMQNVARVSRACAANVRTGNCRVQNRGAVDTVNPNWCTCPGQQAIGTWNYLTDGETNSEEN